MDEVDRVGRQAAEAMRADVHRRVGVEDALRRLHDDDIATVVPLDREPSTGRGRRGWQVLAVAAAAVVLVVVGVVIARRDPSTRVAPNDTAETIAPATTAGSPTTVAATTPTTVAPSTTSTELPLDPAVDALAGFPAPPDRTPSLDAVPRLLPTAPPVGAVTATRTEYADDQATVRDYVQSWFGVGTGPTVLTITTRLAAPANSGDEAIEVLPWDQATFATMAPGYVGLLLVDPSGYVEIWSQGGLTEADVLAIAHGLTMRTEGRPGWDLAEVPPGLSPVHEGWYDGAAMRSILWTDASELVGELTIVRGVPSMFSNPLMGAPTVRFVDVGGVQGLSYDVDERSAVVWSPEPDLIVMVGLYGSVDEAIALARSVGPVDEATWLANTTPASPGADGCNSMFC